MIDANPAYFEMYGYSREEVIGKSLPSELPPEHVDALHALIRRTLAGESCQIEMTAIRKNGERFLIEVRTIPVRYRGATHAITVARDITERMAAEAERAASGGATAASAEDGGDRASGGGDRARLQQHSHRNPWVRGAGSRTPRSNREREAQTLSRTGASIGSARAGPDPAAADLRPRPPRGPQCHLASRTRRGST